MVWEFRVEVLLYEVLVVICLFVFGNVGWKDLNFIGDVFFKKFDFLYNFGFYFMFELIEFWILMLFDLILLYILLFVVVWKICGFGGIGGFCFKGNLEWFLIDMFFCL